MLMIAPNSRACNGGKCSSNCEARNKKRLCKGRVQIQITSPISQKYEYIFYFDEGRVLIEFFSKSHAP